MSEKLKKVLSVIEKIAPSYLAEDWDNVGLQIGDYKKAVKKIMICLEVTKEVVDEAISKSIDMIICHHPLIFKPLKNIKTDDQIGNMVYRLIKNDVALYTAHTNLDIVNGGTNDVLAELLNMKDIKPLVSTSTDEYGLGRVGRLENPMKLSLFCEEIKEKLKMKSLRVIGDINKDVQKIGLCTGSGAEFIHRAYKSSCDCYITGDVKYHEAQYALGLGMPVIDAGHFETEYIVCEPLAEKLKDSIVEKGMNVEVIVSEAYVNPFKII